MSASAMVMPTHREHAEEVHRKAHAADQQELVGVHFWRIQNPLDGFKHDEDRNQYEEDSVRET